MLLGSLLALFISGFLLWLVRPHNKPIVGWLSILPPGLITAWQVLRIPEIAAGNFHTERWEWMPSLGLEISFRLDGLALLFGLIVAGVGAAVALYTHYYLEKQPRQGYFYLALFAFMASMLGLVWADNLLTLFVFWEGTSITSYLLIGFDHESPRARAGARNALIVTGAGGLAMLMGLILLGQSAGSYSISQIIAADGLRESAHYTAAVILIFAGAFTKSAQFPFHFWLPGAMSAPTPASAYLHSATMVKAGIFLLARLHPALSDTPLWFWGLLIFGGITMLIGAFFAIGNYDIKALLAYATVSQLGILTMLLAFGSEYALLGVVVGVLAHALYKGPLFLIAGIVDHATGTRDIRRLAGLLRAIPLTGVVAVLGIVSMAGLPPTFGFLAKETLLETGWELIGHGEALAGWLVFGGGAVAGALFVAYSLTLLWEVFLRREADVDDEAHVHHPPALGFVLPPLALVFLGTAIPFLLGPLAQFIDPAATAISNETIHSHLALWHGFTPVFITSLLAIGSGTLLFLSRSHYRRFLAVLPQSVRGVVFFQRALDGLYGLADHTVRLVQGHTLATQSAVVLLVAFVPVVAALTYTSLGELLPAMNGQAIGWPEMILAFLLALAAWVTVRAESRMSAIISLGVVGVTVTLFYVFFSAPDLALTQLLIEVLTLVLLVLVFYKLPEEKRPPMGRLRQMGIIFVSICVGVTGFVLVLFNGSEAMNAGTAISSYFVDNSVPLGHGANIVNVILVDFRGFDTMGEITVLALAALGGYALLRAPAVRLPDPAERRVASADTAEAEGENH
ncbi:MAG: hydrogen gas-evolving membrane-bound hydrogenase subunit E [Caldilineaceae bacterium]